MSKSITEVIENQLDSLTTGLEWDLCYSFFYNNRNSLEQKKIVACKVLFRYLSAFGMTSRRSFFARLHRAREVDTKRFFR